MRTWRRKNGPELLARNDWFQVALRVMNYQPPPPFSRGSCIKQLKYGVPGDPRGSVRVAGGVDVGSSRSFYSAPCHGHTGDGKDVS